MAETTYDREKAERETRISFEQYQVFKQIEEQRNQYANELDEARATVQRLEAENAELRERASVFEFDSATTVCRCRQRDGSNLWAVRRMSFCLAKDGEWEWEPIPSSRDGEFIKRCRFASYEEAVAALKGDHA